MHWMAHNLIQAMHATDVTKSVIFQTVLAHLGPERSVIDVGAGVGRFSIPLARKAGCRVWAVEPEPLMREHLARHLQEAGPAAGSISVVPNPWPYTKAPRAEVVLSTYVMQSVDRPVAFARAMERAATRQVIVALHIDPMPTTELVRLFQPRRQPNPLRFQDIYPVLLRGGILPDVRIVDEVQYPRFDTSRWAEEMIDRLALRRDPVGRAKLESWIAEKTADGTLGRPHRFALLTWSPGAHDFPPAR